MTKDFSSFFPNDDSCREAARTSLMGTVANMTVLKNIAIAQGLHRMAAEGALEAMTLPEIHALANRERSGLAAATKAVNIYLDKVVIGRIRAILAQTEDTSSAEDPRVITIATEIVRAFEPNIVSKHGVRWPHPAELVDRYYDAHPSGPMVTTLEDGRVITVYLLNGELHRDPSKGPAWHCKSQDGESWMYALHGKAHRDARDGPAVRLVNADGDGSITGEYFEHGIAHRPSIDGPAAVAIDRNGRQLFTAYLEQGKLHRAACEGPALHRIDENGERIEYGVNGVFHRPVSDGPALVTRNTSGAIIKQEYCLYGERVDAQTSAQAKQKRKKRRSKSTH